MDAFHRFQQRNLFEQVISEEKTPFHSDGTSENYQNQLENSISVSRLNCSVLGTAYDSEIRDLAFLLLEEKPGVLVMGADRSAVKVLEDLCEDFGLQIKVVEGGERSLVDKVLRRDNRFEKDSVYIARDEDRFRILENSEGFFTGFSDRAVGKFLGYPESAVENFASRKSEEPPGLEFREKIRRMVEDGKISEEERELLNLVGYIPRPEEEKIREAIEEGERRRKVLRDFIEEFDLPDLLDGLGVHLDRDVRGLREFSKRFYEDRDPVHDFSHILRVMEKAEDLARDREVDQEVMFGGAYLHGVVGDEEKEEVVREFLEDRFSGKRIEKMSRAARESQKEAEPESMEGKILHDAHLLEGGKTFHIVKSFTVGGARDQDLEETIEYLEKNILGEFSCALPESRREYREKERFAKEFLEELKSDLGMDD